MEKSGARKIFLNNKKGVELTLNTVIVAILVVLVLVLLIGFFLGGTGKLKDMVGTIARQTSAGTDISIALDQCKSYCTQAKGWSPLLQSNSPYCKFGFKLDINSDGEAEKEGNKYKEFGCSQLGELLYTPCPEVEDNCNFVADKCGNGLREGEEQCDDGNTANGDGCSSTCSKE